MLLSQHRIQALGDLHPRLQASLERGQFDRQAPPARCHSTRQDALLLTGCLVSDDDNDDDRPLSSNHDDALTHLIDRNAVDPVLESETRVYAIVVCYGRVVPWLRYRTAVRHSLVVAATWTRGLSHCTCMRSVTRQCRLPEYRLFGNEVLRACGALCEVRQMNSIATSIVLRARCQSLTDHNAVCLEKLRLAPLLSTTSETCSACYAVRRSAGKPINGLRPSQYSSGPSERRGQAVLP